MSNNQVHLTAAQFGLLKPGQFDTLMKKIATENDIRINCSCGVCTVEKEASIELSALLRAEIATTNTSQVEQQVNTEELYLNRAACGRQKIVQVSEAQLRRL